MKYFTHNYLYCEVRCRTFDWSTLQCPNAACSDIFYKCMGALVRRAGYVLYKEAHYPKLPSLGSTNQLTTPGTFSNQPKHNSVGLKPKPWPSPPSFSVCLWQWQQPSSGRTTTRRTLPTTTAPGTTPTTGPATTLSRATSTVVSGERRPFSSHLKTGRRSQPGEYLRLFETMEKGHCFLRALNISFLFWSSWIMISTGSSIDWKKYLIQLNTRVNSEHRTILESLPSPKWMKFWREKIRRGGAQWARMGTN